MLEAEGAFLGSQPALERTRTRPSLAFALCSEYTAQDRLPALRVAYFTTQAAHISPYLPISPALRLAYSTTAGNGRVVLVHGVGSAVELFVGCAGEL